MTLRRCIQTLLLSLMFLTSLVYAKNTTHFKKHLLKPVLTMQEYMAHNCKKGCVDERDLLNSVKKVSLIEDIDFRDLLAIIAVESKFQLKAKSGKNLGLTQVNLHYHKKKFKGKDPYDLQVNVEVGAGIYKECLVNHGGNKRKALRCYNGGSKGTPGYADKVLDVYRQMRIIDNHGGFKMEETFQSLNEEQI